MNVVILTTRADELGGVFAKAYYAAGGADPAAVIVVPERSDVGFSGFRGLWSWLKILGWQGLTRVAFARKLGMPITRKDREAGLGDDWVATLARNDVPVHEVAGVNHMTTVELLHGLSPDIVVSVGVPEIITKPVLDCARTVALNVHNGLLPSYRGHFGTFWEIRNGEQECGVSIHEMTNRVDAGRIVAEARISTTSNRSFLDLMIQKKRRGGALLAKVMNHYGVPGVAGPPPVEPHEPRASGYYPWPTYRDVCEFRWPRSLVFRSRGDAC